METDFFNAHMSHLRRDRFLFERADAMLHAAATAEPLIADAMKTPQDPRYHAEGPFVKDHLRLMLMTLYGILEGKMHLKQIEEFARLRGYELEVDELEERFKDHVAWFEVFVFCHDATKWVSVVFRSPEKSRGAELGFNTHLTYEPDVDFAQQAERRAAYLELYSQFADMHPNESPHAIQTMFYATYEIDVKYPHHDRLIHTPVYHALLERFFTAHKITDVHAGMLEDIIAHHLQFKKFARLETSPFSRFVHLASVRHYDLDPFADFIQGALFLDFVAGSVRFDGHSYRHDVGFLIHALRAEHEIDPARRLEKQHAHEEQEHRDRLRLFQEVGLDGVSLLELLGMEPGSAFGRVLKQVQGAVVGKNEMPTFSKSVHRELSSRVAAYYEKAFVKGE